MHSLSRLTFVAAFLLGGCDPAPANSPTVAAEEGTPTNEAEAAAESKACDPAKVAALAEALGGAGQDVGVQLGKACAVPSELAAFLARTGPDADGTEAAPQGAAGEFPKFSSVCEGAEKILSALPELPEAERMAAMYDRCKLERLGIMDRAKWLAGQPTSRTPWTAYSWLVDQGVDEAAAKTVVQALLRRDAKRWEAPGQTLARVEHPLPLPPRRGVTLVVTPGAMMIDGRDVVKLDKGMVASADKAEADKLGAHFVGPLFDVLAEEADRRKETTKAAGTSWDKTLVIVADAQTPHPTLADILASAAKAEFSRYALVVEAADGYGALEVSARALDSTGRNAKVDFEVFIKSVGFDIQPHGSVAEGMIVERRPDGSLDYDGLAAAVEKFEASGSKAGTASVWPLNAAPLVDLARTLAVLRGRSCAEDGKGCAFANLAIQAQEPNVAPVTGGRVLAVLGGGGAGGGGGGDISSVFNDSDIGDLSGDGSSKESELKGPLDKTVIRHVVRRNRRSVQYCYQKALAKQPTLAGVVEVSFTIGADGKVTNVKMVKDEIADKSVSKCMKTALERWRFPKPADGEPVDVSYPFRFESK